MEMITNFNDNALSVEVIGRLDTTTSPKLEETLSEQYENIDSLVLDFKELKYVSSAGLRVLLQAQKAMSKKGGMKLINVNSNIMDVFEVTGFSEFLTIE